MSSAEPPLRRSQRRRAETSTESPPKRQKRTTINSPSPKFEIDSIKCQTKQQSPANPETIQEDDLCPICHLLLHQPVLTTCNHTLCSACMTHWAEVSLSNMVILPIDNEHEEITSMSDPEVNCPMCRTQTTFAPDPTRASTLAARYPSTYSERGAMDLLPSDQQTPLPPTAGGVQPVTLLIGNTHSLLLHPPDAASPPPAPPSSSPNQHEWTFFLRPSRADIIEEVQIQLHPTFRPDRIIRQRPPFEIRRLGWGVFTVIAYVVLKAGWRWVDYGRATAAAVVDSPDGAERGMLVLEWELDFVRFEGKGSMGRVRVGVENDWEGSTDGEEVVRDEREWRRVVRAYQLDGRYEPPDEEA